MEFIVKDCKMISQYQYLSSNKRYYSKRGKDFIKKFQTIIRSQMLTKGYKILESDNIECEVIAYFDNKRKNDVDNFVKPVLDNLEKCNVFIDDRYIKRLIIEKRYQKPLDVCAIIKIRDRNKVLELDIAVEEKNVDNIYTNQICQKNNQQVKNQKVSKDVEDH